MKITWIGHACFKIEKDGYIVIIDPYADGYIPGYAPIKERADLVLCTHDHEDHNASENIEIIGGAECPFEISEIEVFHDEQDGKLRGKTKVYILDDGECRIAHLGDIGCELTDEQMEKLYQLDYLMLPVGGCYTIGARDAAQLTVNLDPRYALPMHYRSVESRFGLDELGTVYDYAGFLSRILIVSRSEIDTDEDIPARVIILQPQNLPENED